MEYFLHRLKEEGPYVTEKRVELLSGPYDVKAIQVKRLAWVHLTEDEQIALGDFWFTDPGTKGQAEALVKKCNVKLGTHVQLDMIGSMWSALVPCKEFDRLLDIDTQFAILGYPLSLRILCE